MGLGNHHFARVGIHFVRARFYRLIIPYFKFMVQLSKHRAVFPCFNFCSNQRLFLLHQIIAMQKIYDLIQCHIRNRNVFGVSYIKNKICYRSDI